MAVDKDRPSSWVKYRDGLCNACKAGCCHMPLEVNAEDLIRLNLASEDESPKQIAKRLLKEGVVKTYRAQTGLFLLQQRSDDSCQFLEKSAAGVRCMVYENRPKVCRGFPVTIGPRVGFCPYNAIGR